MSKTQTSFDQWNRVRAMDVQATSRSFYGRIPVISFLIRSVIRIATLGRVWNAQAIFYRALIADLNALDSQITQIKAQQKKNNQ